ncbi:hypothetical protein ACGFY3_20520 [Streptomyces mirabilis]|uniref:hypothetical protein n=1 Tax=Streptomyces mirabilis TaxID=68239 RepID=UPI00371FB489
MPSVVGRLEQHELAVAEQEWHGWAKRRSTILRLGTTANPLMLLLHLMIAGTGASAAKQYSTRLPV